MIIIIIRPIYFSIHARFWCMNCHFAFFTFLSAFSAFVAFFALAIVFFFSYFIHSNFPSPGCLIVKPTLGLSPLYDIATILAKHSSFFFKILFESFPKRVLVVEKLT